jgi:hypothetical protein
MTGVLLEAELAYSLPASGYYPGVFDMCPMLPMSLACPFLIANSVLYNLFTLSISKTSSEYVIAATIVRRGLRGVVMVVR